MNLSKLTKNIATSRNFSFCSRLQKAAKEKPIDQEPVSFVTDKKEKFINRLYAFGHTGTGALGRMR